MSAPFPRILRAFVGTVVPEAVTLDDNGWRELEELVARSLSDRPRVLRLRLQLFMQFVQWWPLIRHRRPFTSLDPITRHHFLTRLQTSENDSVRLGFWGLRTLAFLGFYGRRAAAEAIGYRPSPKGWEAWRP